MRKTRPGIDGSEGGRVGPCRQPLEGEEDPQLTASKEMGPQSYNCLELNSANDLGCECIPKASTKEHSSPNTLILVL